MTAETSKNLWRVAWLGLAAVLVWKLWPYVKDMLTGGNSGSGGAVGGAGAYPGANPYESQGSGSGGGPQVSFGAGSGSPGSGSSSGLAGWLNSILGQGQANAAALDATNGSAGDFSSLGSLDSQGLPLEPTQNFDVNELATDLPTNASSAQDVADTYDASQYTDTVDSFDSTDAGLVADQFDDNSDWSPYDGG